MLSGALVNPFMSMYIIRATQEVVAENKMRYLDLCSQYKIVFGGARFKATLQWPNKFSPTTMKKWTNGQMNLSIQMHQLRLIIGIICVLFLSILIMSTPTLCPCGSGKPYQQCCQVYHQQCDLPDTPEQLMRSRYTAFCLNLSQYLVDSLLPEKRTPNLFEELEAYCPTVHFVKLEVIKSDFENAQVEFKAWYREDEKAQRFYCLHEVSNFEQVNGRWFYKDGQLNEEQNSVELKRNDDCICLSGKKFKRCCGRA